MESNGLRGRIHCSQDTADLLTASGKGHWVIPREDKIVAKGKGEMKTYWVEVKQQSSPSAASRSSCSEGSDTPISPLSSGLPSNAAGVPLAKSKLSAKSQRLVAWNVDILSRLLKQIISRRIATNAILGGNAPKVDDDLQSSISTGGPIKEVVEIIELPEYDARAAREQPDPESIELDPAVKIQLHEFVTSTYICFIIWSLMANPF